MLRRFYSIPPKLNHILALSNITNFLYLFIWLVGVVSGLSGGTLWEEKNKVKTEMEIDHFACHRQTSAFRYTIHKVRPNWQMTECRVLPQNYMNQTFYFSLSLFIVCVRVWK